MIPKFRNKAIRKKYGDLRENHRPKGIKSLDSVGIILDLDLLDGHQIEKLTRAFRADSGTLRLIAVSTVKKKRENFDGLVFRPDQITRKGELKPGSDAEKFTQGTYDLLINYYVTPNPKLLLFGALLDTNLRVGFAMEDADLGNDLDISLKPSELDEFIREVKSCLIKINH